MSKLNRSLAAAAAAVTLAAAFGQNANGAVAHVPWRAMDSYATCRHGGVPPWHTSSIRTGTGPVYESQYPDGAQIIVLVGPSSANDGGPLHGRSHVEWITRNGVKQLLFRFERLRNVGRRLNAITAGFHCR